jgi:putative ABC transport system permease protein
MSNGTRMSTLIGFAWREGRAARRRLLLYMSSISLGVAALVAIDSFGQNVTQSVREQARSLLGGDVALSSREAFPARIDSLLDSLSRTGTGIARVTTLSSMANVPRSGRTRLVQVRGVSVRYPFYGAIETTPSGVLATVHDRHAAIVDPSILVSLQARVGDTISIGTADFVIAGVIDRIPGDVGVTAVVAPRIIVGERYLPETKLLVLGSRSERQVILKVGPDMSPVRLAARLRPRVEKTNVRLRTAAKTQNDLTDAFEKLSGFLGIVGLVALLLGGVGVASGVHAFVTRKIDVAAILRCLGATSRQVLFIYVLQAAAMGLIGALTGALLGVGIQLLLPRVAGSMLPINVGVHLEPQAILLGLAIGIWVALAFALWPLVALRRVSPLQTLRRDADADALQLGRFDIARVVVALAIVGSVATIVLSRSETVRDGIAFTVAIGVSIGVLAAVAALVSRGARALLRARWPFVVRQGISSLYRPGNQTRAVMLALGFGVFLVSTLYQVGSTLVRRFTLTANDAAANVVFFDVQPDQAAGLDSAIRAGGWTVIQRVPIVTMRIAALNGRSVDSLLTDSARVRTPNWAWRREYRSTFRDTAVASEHIVSGRWFGGTRRAVGDTVPEVSFERDVATDMRLKLGDVITWDVQGVRVPTRITSFREVDWAQFSPNFFAVLEPRALTAAPAQYVLLAKVPGDSAVQQLQHDVVVSWPNISSIDLSLVQRTIEGVVRQVSTAVRFLALFSITMGVPVLFSAVAATRRARMREGVLLKTLGATRRQVRAILVAEYAALGALGALTGLLLSFGSAWALAHYTLDVAYRPAFVPAIWILAGMLALVLSIGLLAGREVYSGTPMDALREG